ncbi:hypothetical protein CDAR_268641 [Caerostris darwini]|uniref:Uncharacterized protein n=1 Tax=Caerostris darwini TaxID=1538125 RepID=A0AAV4X3I0_9ARAC|nr:hypothetical protein CDAR_268641 [Caerostris darwini]
MIGGRELSAASFHRRQQVALTFHSVGGGREGWTLAIIVCPNILLSTWMLSSSIEGWSVLLFERISSEREDGESGSLLDLEKNKSISPEVGKPPLWVWLKWELKFIEGM